MTAIDISQIRAVRNHNPLNIERGQPWLGLMDADKMTPAQAGEHRFCVFVDDPHGFRAAGLILKRYAQELVFPKAFCIRDIIARWAPPPENNTGAYIQDVWERTGFVPDAILPVDIAHVSALCQAMSTHEVGVWAFEFSDVLAGLKMIGF